MTRYITGRPLTREEVWSRLLRHAGHWQWLGFGYWALEEKSSGECIGELGFADYQREIEPSVSGTPELGYSLAAPAQRKGYATEALAAAIAWGDERFATARTVCLVNPANAVSLRMAAKCGYREFARGRYKGEITVMLERFAVKAR